MLFFTFVIYKYVCVYIYVYNICICIHTQIKRECECEYVYCRILMLCLCNVFTSLPRSIGFDQPKKKQTDTHCQKLHSCDKFQDAKVMRLHGIVSCYIIIAVSCYIRC